MSSAHNPGYLVPGKSRVVIRESALHARRGLQLEGRIDMPRLLDRLSMYGVHYDVRDSSVDPMPPGVEAFFVPEEMTINIRDTVYREMSRGGQRALFTLGHELGHVLLGHRHSFNRFPSAQIPAYANSEWQANTFAAEFTMPLDEILKFDLTEVMQLVSHFGVSSVAAEIRLKDLTSRNETRKNRRTSVNS